MSNVTINNARDLFKLILCEQDITISAIPHSTIVFVWSKNRDCKCHLQQYASLQILWLTEDSCRKENIYLTHIQGPVIQQWRSELNNVPVWMALHFSRLFPWITGGTDTGDSQTGPYLFFLPMQQFSILSLCAFFPLVYMFFSPFRLINNFTCYPCCPRLFVFCTTSVFSLFLTCLSLFPHPTCLRFLSLTFPFLLPVTFCRHD